MTIPAPQGGRPSVADIYRGYFFRLFETQYPDEGARFDRLREAGHWCLETYWQSGRFKRKLTYDASELQRRLLDAGVLVPADKHEPPLEVQFFHNSMQSFLTAFGLAEQDRAGYPDLPRSPGDEGSVTWNRSRVLLRAAADPVFEPTLSDIQESSDILESSGTELFAMCLFTFTPAADLRRWLRDELRRWAAVHGGGKLLLRKNFLAAMTPSVRMQVKATRGLSHLLEKAADACFDADDRADSVETLGRLYAGIATLVFKLTDSGIEDVEPPAVEDDSLA